MDSALSTKLKVVDLTHHIAGPLCTKLLAGFGAEVIKIEKPGEGDRSRSFGPFPQDEPHQEKSGAFLYLNTHKKSITLNLKSKLGRRILKRLVEDADVVVENFEPRVMSSLGLSYSELCTVNAKLVMTSISNFGQDGAYRDYKATNLTELAWGGALFLEGYVERPFKMGSSRAEEMAGLVAYVGTMAALCARDGSGKGQHVDISIRECVTNNIELSPVLYAYMGLIRKRGFGQLMQGHPVKIYPCKDGHIVVIPGLGATSRIALLIDKPELLDHILFTNAAERLARRDEFDAMILPWFREHGKYEIVAKAQELRMPFGVVQNMDEVLEDEHLKDREFFVEIQHPIAGGYKYPGAPFRMTESVWQAGRAPLLGEHNEEIYCGRLGYSKRQLVALRQTGIT
jgi:crotonobetainyl-CoA:carnitine CoA-transferase CaiB-like acyl-CoA transferase